VQPEHLGAENMLRRVSHHDDVRVHQHPWLIRLDHDGAGMNEQRLDALPGDGNDFSSGLFTALGFVELSTLEPRRELRAACSITLEDDLAELSEGVEGGRAIGPRPPASIPAP